MSEALIYNCHPLECQDARPMYSHIVSVCGKGGGSAKRYMKPTRSMTTTVPSSSYEALRYAVAALNRLDDFNCEKIGAGFFSEVFKVTHRTTGQVMVLKMNTSLSNRANMLREVQLMNRLSHDNILRFMGVCVHEGQLHALTEFINGGSLEQLLQNKHLELSWETRIKLSLDIARGMSYLHSRGVFHRDLTSKNVLIKMEPDGMTAVVGDFGLAEKIPDSRDRSQRLPIVGSPYWMAPECLKGKWYNNKADVFSFGIILCEIIARIEADPDILPRTENFGVDYVAFSEMCPDCPPQFLELAFTSCRMDPNSRPSFKEIAHNLEKMLNVISSMSGGSHLFYPPVVYTTCWDDGDSIDNVRAIFAHGWNRPSAPQSKSPSREDGSPVKVPHSNVPQLPVTPKHIGEAMSIRDPHYKPYSSSHNPFASLPRFWKGKKFLEPSLSDIDLAHSMDSSPPGETPGNGSSPLLKSRMSRNWSRSCPTSPVLPRRPLKLETMFQNEDLLPDTPRSVSPGPLSPGPLSLSSSSSPFEVDDAFSVQEQMSDCKLEDGPPQKGPLRTKTKLRRSSGESGFFSVGDRSGSACDLSLEGYPSWTSGESPSDTDENGTPVLAPGRKRPSSCYSDDSCCCHSPSLCEVEDKKDLTPKSEFDPKGLCHVCCSSTPQSLVGDAVSSLNESLMQSDVSVAFVRSGDAHVSSSRHNGVAKTCQKGKRIAKCMRTSAD